MRKYKIVRESDANDYFEFEAESREDALYDALQSLGWYCVEVKDIDATMREINNLLGEE